MYLYYVRKYATSYASAPLYRICTHVRMYAPASIKQERSQRRTTYLFCILHSVEVVLWEWLCVVTGTLLMQNRIDKVLEKLKVDLY